MNYEKELSVAIDVSKRAGAVLMGYFGGKSGAKLKEDGTSITDADVESNQIIVDRLKEEFPEDGIISEEINRIEGERKWYVDPLDGTRSFIDGVEDFSIHIGLCVTGEPVLGVVFKPATGDLYCGVVGRGAFKEDSTGYKTPLDIKNKDNSNLIVASTSAERESKELKNHLGAAGVNGVIRVGCTGLRIMKIVENEADLFVTPSDKLRSWDLCAPHAILKASGAYLSYSGGEAINYDSYFPSNKIVVGAKSEKQFSQIRQAIA